MTKYYKFLTVDNKGEYSRFDFTDYLPTADAPGAWLPEIERIELCQSGYHGFTAHDVMAWLNAQLFEVELDGETIAGDDKTVAQRMRIVRKIDAWNDKSARLFACWCVRQVWHLLTDERSRNAVEVAERYANGQATQDELAAACDAAWDAAGDAAWAAAGDAARAAAWVAARAAAGDAARAAAWVAARAAAGDAAGDAAWDAAWDAAKAAQPKHLIEILGLEA